MPDLEAQKIDSEANQAIMRGEYERAIKAVSAGSGDTLILALLAIAKELSYIRV